MSIDRIAELLSMVNGDVFDVSDDIIPEGKLYDYLCETVRRMDSRGISEEETGRIIGEVTAEYTGPSADSVHRLRLALFVMVCAYVSAELKREAELYFLQLKEGRTDE